MSSSRSKQSARPRGRPRVTGPYTPPYAAPAAGQVPDSPPSLPPVDVTPTTQTPFTPVPCRTCHKCGKRYRLTRRKCPNCHTPKRPDPPTWRKGLTAKEAHSKQILSPDSTIRSKALHICALRVSGLSEEDIAKAMNLKPRTLSAYVYIAGKNGWLQQAGLFADARDEIDYTVIHKAIENLRGLLDSADPEQKERVTMKTLEGTVFKTYDAQKGSAAPPSTMLAIKIEMPPAGTAPVREDAIGGLPAYVDAESPDAAES